MSEVKKFLYINRKAPYGTIYALESLEVVLIGAAFEQDVSLAFLDDGVYQITKGQKTEEVGMKNFSPTYKALGDFDVNKIYVEQESLDARGLTLDDLLPLFVSSLRIVVVLLGEIGGYQALRHVVRIRLSVG